MNQQVTAWVMSLFVSAGLACNAAVVAVGQSDVIISEKVPKLIEALDNHVPFDVAFAQIQSPGVNVAAHTTFYNEVMAEVRVMMSANPKMPAFEKGLSQLLGGELLQSCQIDLANSVYFHHAIKPGTYQFVEKKTLVPDIEPTPGTFGIYSRPNSSSSAKELVAIYYSNRSLAAVEFSTVPIRADITYKHAGIRRTIKVTSGRGGTYLVKGSYQFEFRFAEQRVAEQRFATWQANLTEDNPLVELISRP